MKIIADLQLHSKYSRAVSPQMVLPEIARWIKRKGMRLVATGDWTHPLWLREIKTNLEELGNGLLKLKTSPKSSHLAQGGERGGVVDEFDSFEQFADGDEPLFLLASEVSCIYSQGGQGRRIHTLIWAPSIAVVDKINAELTRRGANLMSDGRPIIGLTSINVAEIVFSIDPTCLVIPAHAWTPWFSLYGSESGFDSIDECFGEYARYIYAIETGLSSDPAMNWRIKELDRRAILSFSDAHSGPKLGREATIFELEELSYQAVREAIMEPASQQSTINNQQSTSKNRISCTIEFYPEEGKYHYTGHRNCQVKHTPDETRKLGTVCPVCRKKLTVGVMHRVDELAGRSEEEVGANRKGMWIYSKLFPDRPPYTMLVPLQEILAEALYGRTATQKVQEEYIKLTARCGGEFQVLLKTPTEDIAKVSGERVAEGIDKVRHGQIVVDPGYDGVFGVVKIWQDEKEKQTTVDEKKQLSLF